MKIRTYILLVSLILILSANVASAAEYVFHVPVKMTNVAAEDITRMRVVAQIHNETMTEIYASGHGVIPVSSSGSYTGTVTIRLTITNPLHISNAKKYRVAITSNTGALPPYDQSTSSISYGYSL